jgi:5-methylcytosine-specific restriction protein A
MPMKPPRICGCGYRIAYGQRCPCERARKADADKRRPTARQRGYDSKWETAARVFLMEPENRYCACGCRRRAGVVDHIKPHRGDMALFWDRSNWQALAASPCHSSRKQSSEAKARGRTRVSRLGAGTGDGQDREILLNSVFRNPDLGK